MQVIYTGVSPNNDCFVTIANNPSTSFLCIVSSNIVNIYTNSTFSNTNVLISVLVGITNPSSNINARVRMYHSYASTSSFVTLSDT